MLRRHHHVGRAKQRIAAGRVDAQLILFVLDGKVHFRSHGFTDPVLLGNLDALHIVHRVKTFDQLVRVLRDL